MGIVNVTPDSFSGDGSKDAASALAHALQLLEDGADVLDVGGESTRPGAVPTPPAVELARVLPVVVALVARGVRCISVDTQHASTARACLHAGAAWINDVGALNDPAMAAVAAQAEALVLMHWRRSASHDGDGDHVVYASVIDDVRAFLAERRARAIAAGVDAARIVVDPGLGFGKSVDDNVALLANARAFTDLGAVLVGPSRKRFLGALAHVDEPAQRGAATLGAVSCAAVYGADFVRVHDVKSAVQCLRVVDACVRGR
jgi:dihydropteroate synthase